MGAYDSMKRQLLPTGLYTLDGTTAVDSELQAYAAGLDAVCSEFQELQGESFLPTASGYGLELKERAFALLAAGDTSARRAALTTLGSVGRQSGTKEKIEQAFSALGLDVTLLEDPANLKITARFNSMPACGETEAQKKLEIFSPAHLTVEPDFSAAL